MTTCLATDAFLAALDAYIEARLQEHVAEAMPGADGYTRAPILERAERQGAWQHLQTITHMLLDRSA